ncbi:YheC/YheD family protein [Alicyclobacillus ferrooxydans]|uniref:ATP-grasp domain-containing protein n=1 Tax=Alicyclobacillus ferrooxydans TaxID=471514 RepID=A0A0P9CF83_9BACL|nr:YheC/YheD family protein [Alicyclobacillus ferrooxydans]KPV44258.1 hypothetical protein AN477_08155 [Alicyclobacillus ferrooxydans]
MQRRKPGHGQLGQRRKPELGKYLLWWHFSKNKSIRPYLPATARMTKQVFLRYLSNYGMVYVKPSGGSRGVGVMKVWSSGTQVFVKKTVLPTRSFKNAEAAWDFINQQRNGKPYIVQQGIRLAKVGGRPFDIRVMVQREAPGSAWKYSGMLAKIAGKSSVVTNVALSNGSVLEVSEAMKRAYGWDKSTIERRISELKRVSLQAANHFDTYQKYRELGFDMALDTKGKLWLIEENTGPSHPLFKRLKSNLKMWRLIQYRYGLYSRALSGRK